MDLSHTCPRRGLDQGSGAIFKIYPLVFPRRKNTRGWPLPSWSTSRTSTTMADTWLVGSFQPAKLARVLRTPGRSKCSVSKREWSPLSEKSTFGSKTNQRTIFPSDAPQVSLRLGASLDPDNLRTGAWSFFHCGYLSRILKDFIIRFYNQRAETRNENKSYGEGHEKTCAQEMMCTLSATWEPTQFPTSWSGSIT